MASKQATPETLLTLATLVKTDEIKTLRIVARKSGDNKGKLWADWTTKNPEANEHLTRLERQKISALIEEAATRIHDGQAVLFELYKAGATINRYNHRLEVTKL